MTQQCKYDEQLLDYVYGELEERQRQSFAEHLSGCPACTAQVASFGLVRKEFAQQPPIEPAGESMQRMRALLMQAAATEVGAKGAAGVGEGGKVLALRPRGIRRILFHPASGIMAAAAVALLWVVFRGQPEFTPGPPATASGPATIAAATPTAEPASKAAAGKGAAAPVTALSADPMAAAPAGNEKSKELAVLVPPAQKPAEVAAADRPDDFDGLRARSKAKVSGDSLDTALLAQAPTTPAKSATTVTAADAKPMAELGKVAALKTLDARAGTYRPSNSSTIVAMADKSYGRAAKSEVMADQERQEGRFAQPPPAAEAPPPAPPPPAAASAREEDESVRGAIARTQEQRKQKVVDELANQELAGLGSGLTAGAPNRDSRMTQHQAGASAGNKGDTAESGRGMPTPSDSDDVAAPAAVAAAPAPSAGPAARGADDGATALSAIKDQLRRGQCADADAALTKLERAFPATRGLTETRAEWQTACASPGQQLLERSRRAPAAEPNFAPPAAAPMVSPSRPAFHAAKKSYAPAPRMAAKPAPIQTKAPAKADAASSRAADSLK